MQDEISNQRLVGCHPALIERVNAAATELALSGIYFRVIEAGRTFAESNADYQRGRNGNPGPIITNAPGGYSWHNFNMAVDCAPFVAGTTGVIDWDASSPNFQAMITALTSAGVPQRGGCKGDNDHFEMLEIPAVPTEPIEQPLRQVALTLFGLGIQLPHDLATIMVACTVYRHAGTDEV